MTKADMALIERVPPKGSEIDVYFEWLDRNHFIKKNSLAEIDETKNELIFKHEYDPPYKRYKGYAVNLHIKLKIDVTKCTIAHRKTLLYSPYCKPHIIYFYLILETPNGDKILID